MADASDTFFYFWPSDNVAPLATISVIDGTEDPAYPAANATDLSFAMIAAPAKLLETEGGWQGDFGTARRVDLAVIWHNGDEDLPMVFEMDAAAAWGGSPGATVSESFVLPAKRADGYTRKVGVDLRLNDNYSTGGFRFFHVAAGGSPSNSQPLGIKILLYSRVRQLSRDFRWGVTDSEHHISITQKTDAGVRWAYDMTGAPRSLRGSGLLTDTDAEAVREWFRASAGTVKPITIIPEPTINDAWVGYFSPGGVSIESATLGVAAISNTREFADANATELQFEEVTAGDPEWY